MDCQGVRHTRTLHRAQQYTITTGHLRCLLSMEAQHTTNRDELISTNRSFSLSPSVRKTTTQHRATGTELGTDTKPTLEVGGVPSLPRGESRAASVPSLPRAASVPSLPRA